MSDTNESLVTIKNALKLSEAAKIVNKSPSAVFRWYRDGCHGVRLQCLRMGKSLLTSEEALERFGRDVAAAHAAKRAANASPTSDDHDLDTNVDGL